MSSIAELGILTPHPFWNSHRGMSGLSKRVAIVVEPSLPRGLLANTVATISIRHCLLRREVSWCLSDLRSKLHLFAEYIEEFRNDLAEEQIDGLGLVGPAKWVSSLTGSLKLLR